MLYVRGTPTLHAPPRRRQSVYQKQPSFKRPSGNGNVHGNANSDNNNERLPPVRRLSGMINEQFSQFTDYLTERPEIDLTIREATQEEKELDRRFLGETVQETLSINRGWMQKVLRFLLFFAVGIVAYTLMEEWSFRDCVYFITQTISTLGYGNITPESRGGRLFSVFYIYIGILLTFSVIGDVATFFIVYMRERYDVEKQKLRRMNRLQVLVRSVINCVMWIAILFLVPIFGAIFFSANEGWPFIDSMYFATYTATSVGYGDMTLSKNSSIWFNVVYILIGITVTTVALQKISSFKRHFDESELKQILNAIEPSEELFNAISRGKKNEVSSSEYVLHMLQLSGKIDSLDIAPWMEKFNEFDLDRDGSFTLKDVHCYEQLLKRGQLKKAKLFRPHRKKSIFQQITIETKDVFLETLKLKKASEEEVNDGESSRTTSNAIIELSSTHSNPSTAHNSVGNSVGVPSATAAPSNVSPKQQAMALRRASDLKREQFKDNVSPKLQAIALRRASDLKREQLREKENIISRVVSGDDDEENQVDGHVHYENFNPVFEDSKVTFATNISDDA